MAHEIVFAKAGPVEGGWALGEKRWHYFIAERSLCGKYSLPGAGVLVYGNDDHAQNCVKCKRVLFRRRERVLRIARYRAYRALKRDEKGKTCTNCGVVLVRHTKGRGDSRWESHYDFHRRIFCTIPCTQAFWRSEFCRKILKGEVTYGDHASSIPIYDRHIGLQNHRGDHGDSGAARSV